MAVRKPHHSRLLSKIQSLPPDKAAEVEDFIDFLHQRERERQLQEAVSRASEPSFAELWDNPDDAAYDEL
jgi:hypothetical protein